MYDLPLRVLPFWMLTSLLVRRYGYWSKYPASLLSPSHRTERTSSASNECAAMVNNTNSEFREEKDIFIAKHDELFLQPIEKAVERVLEKYGGDTDILSIPSAERESFGVATNLNDRLKAFRRNSHCPRCWLQSYHCVCSKCPPHSCTSTMPQRIFVLMHHKEVCLTVDTAKMILAAYPERTRLVVGGIGPEFQDSMQEMLDAMQRPECLVLFPSDEAAPFSEVIARETVSNVQTHSIDLVVLDGTWDQARRLYKRYIRSMDRGGPRPVRLTQEALDMIDSKNSQPDSGLAAFSGRQLRRHPDLWREISTLAAVRLFLRDMSGGLPDAATWDVLASYQAQADAAARAQLGSIRLRNDAYTTTSKD